MAAETKNPLIINGSRPNDPARQGFVVSLSDTVDIPGGTRAFMVNATAGDLKVTLIDDDTPIVLKGLLLGIVYPIAIKRAWATGGTTVTEVVGFR